MGTLIIVCSLIVAGDGGLFSSNHRSGAWNEPARAFFHDRGLDARDLGRLLPGGLDPEAALGSGHALAVALELFAKEKGGVDWAATRQVDTRNRRGRQSSDSGRFLLTWLAAMGGGLIGFGGLIGSLMVVSQDFWTFLILASLLGIPAYTTGCALLADWTGWKFFGNPHGGLRSAIWGASMGMAAALLLSALLPPIGVFMLVLLPSAGAAVGLEHYREIDRKARLQERPPRPRSPYYAPIPGHSLGW